MNNLLYKITTIKPKCINQQDGSVNIQDFSSGVLSFSWLDLNSDCTVTDSGKTVYGIRCGTYTLKVYNIPKKTSEIITIDLSCSAELSIDLIHVDEIKCYTESVAAYIEWSGGSPPYKLQVNNDVVSLSTNSYNYNIKPNHIYHISIIDNNGCTVSRNNIGVQFKPLAATVQWDAITKHNGCSPMVQCSVSGGAAPYKIAWFVEGDTKPIIVNQNKLCNILKANNYELVIIDSNDCKITKNFSITQPPPISANITVFNDYSTKSLFEPMDTQTVYNLLLIKENDIPIEPKNFTEALVYIKYNKQKIPQKLCMDYGSITIDSIKYFYFYISPGIVNIQSHKIILVINDIEIDLEYKFGGYKSKLVVGSLIMRNDNSFAYKNNDIICITSDKNTINVKIDQPYIKTGLYLSNDIYTIINITDPNGLKFINQYKQYKIQSLTTKSNNRLGSIICNVSNADKATLSAQLTNEHGDITEYSFNNKYTLSINNLIYGKYKLKVSDCHSIASIFNSQNIANDHYDIVILDSHETEREQASIQSANIFGLDQKLLNQYNNRPNRLLFSDPEFKNGVLMNISPLDCCYTIIGNNINIQDCGYKIIKDLPHGKYNIKIFKDGFITQDIKLFYNTNKDLITAILQKDLDA